MANRPVISGGKPLLSGSKPGIVADGKPCDCCCNAKWIPLVDNASSPTITRYPQTALVDLTGFSWVGSGGADCGCCDHLKSVYSCDLTDAGFSGSIYGINWRWNVSGLTAMPRILAIATNNWDRTTGPLKSTTNFSCCSRTNNVLSVAVGLNNFNFPDNLHVDISGGIGGDYTDFGFSWAYNLALTTVSPSRCGSSPRNSVAALADSYTLTLRSDIESPVGAYALSDTEYCAPPSTITLTFTDFVEDILIGTP